MRENIIIEGGSVSSDERRSDSIDCDFSFYPWSRSLSACLYPSLSACPYPSLSVYPCCPCPYPYPYLFPFPFPYPCQYLGRGLFPYPCLYLCRHPCPSLYPYPYLYPGLCLYLCPCPCPYPSLCLCRVLGAVGPDYCLSVGPFRFLLAPFGRLYRRYLPCWSCFLASHHSCHCRCCPHGQTER